MALLYRRLNGEDAHEAGLSLLKELYGGALPEIRRTPLGKPYFPHSNLHFSISHTPLHAFCVTSQKPVGIDAEEKGRPPFGRKNSVPRRAFPICKGRG